MNFKKNFKRFFSLTRSAEGFTLVELIVVIAILAILAGVAVPAYSGYIKRANEAMDLQNISMLNNLFVVTCIANNADPAEVLFDVDYDDTTKIFSGISSVRRGGDPDPIQTEFNTAMGEPIQFKSDKIDEAALIDGIRNGVQETVTVEYNGMTIKVSKKLAEALKNNTFSELGAEKLLGKVDTVADIAAGLLDPANLENPNSVFEKMLYDDLDIYLGGLMGTLGIGEDDEEAFNKFVDLAYNEDGTPNSSFLANSLVLTAAQKTQGMDTSFLGTAGSAETLRKQLESTDTATSTEAMAKLALTYGMYTSYVNSSYGAGLTDETETMLETKNFSGMTSVLATIENQNFQDYLNSDEGKADLNAYMASMQIVNDSASSSPDAAMDILANGFNSNELSSVLNGLMGN